MIQWDKHIKIWQLVGAVLAVPAGVAGTYGVFHNYLSDGVSCPQLKSSIIATLERNISAEAKRALLQETVRNPTDDAATQIPTRAWFSTPKRAASDFGYPAERSGGRRPADNFRVVEDRREARMVVMIRRCKRNEQANFDADGIPVSSKSPPQIGCCFQPGRSRPSGLIRKSMTAPCCRAESRWALA